MLDTLLLMRLVLAFVVGAVWVSVVTVVADRKGSSYAILGGLPSTAAFSLLFIAVNQSPQVAVDATVAFPLAFSVTNAFLLFYAYFSQRGFRVGLSVSLLVWFCASIIIVVSGVTSYAFSLAVGSVVSVMTLYVFARKVKISKAGGTQVYSMGAIAGRGMGAGVLVAVAVLLSQVGGPILGGVAAAFPAVYASTMIILYRRRGVEFSRSAVKAMAISGILTVIPYSVAVHFLYPAVGVWVGTLLSYLFVVPLAVGAYFIAKGN